MTVSDFCTVMYLCLFFLTCISSSITFGILHGDSESSRSTRREFDILKDVIQGHRLRSTFGGHSFKKSYHLRDNGRRRLKVSHRLLQRIISELVAGKDFTFLVTARQKPNNRGSLIAFTHQRRKRFLELQSLNSQKHEYRYHHLFTLAATHVHTEHLPYMPLDGRWHKIALSVSGTLLELRVDCRRVFTRRIPYPPPQGEFVEPHRRIQLWVGQRGLHRSIFEGSISEAKIITGPDGYEVQCPKADFASMSQIESLTTMFQTLQQEVNHLQRKLQNSERKLENLQKCDCARSCQFGGRRIEDGQIIKNGSCTNCTCKRGQFECVSVVCPPLHCKNPVRLRNSCCPKCLESCEHGHTVFEHGEKIYQKNKQGTVCVVCTCHNGYKTCKPYRNFTEICPKLNCPLSQQFTSPRHCCKFCPGMDFCSSGNRCHKDATCHNTDVEYICRCKSGYKGNGYYCQDIDECQNSHKDLCGHNSKCHNLNGSYRCQCSHGFERGTYDLCHDIDECLNSSTCPVGSNCSNTVGSYRCLCPEGFKMISEKCVPICHCHNGGTCVKPGICRCPFGFYGKDCAQDVDECRLGIHDCKENATCFNIPGSYYCQCRTGFSDFSKGNEVCKDVNECSGRSGISFTCDRTMSCVNQVGGYKCVCKTNSSSCRKDCILAPSYHSHRVSKIPHGKWIGDVHDRCTTCSCKDGVLTCQRKPCNCSSSDDLLCCPECFKGQCHENNRTFSSGEKWISNCRECLCLNGTALCNTVKCPSTRWCDGATITPEGHCCPICLGFTRSECHTMSRSADNSSCQHLPETVRYNITTIPSLYCQCQSGAICCTQRLTP